MLGELAQGTALIMIGVVIGWIIWGWDDTKQKGEKQ